MREIPLLDNDIAQAIQRGAFIRVIVSSDDDDVLVRHALGCRIADDRNKVVIFISAGYSASQFIQLRKESAIEVEFSLLAANQCVGIKGRDVRFVALRSDDLDLIEKYRRIFTAEAVALGKRESMARSMVPEKFTDIVAVSFTPTSAFVQRHRHAPGAMPDKIA